ncbi:hypothetical protein QCD60_10315 [Pokkaliibacter sp. MBI-7]|uniref:hypothetical protein n=1 Tax=Pokkaliibacter sp. MBI-7 TaxID=3040600 RepID=UPI00244721F7|nr:hypothetical protein [Pokkaliibacter sp. MBI-7]MDH2432960.1 hypothetical protein [Pokkaliibacter sp. MBI-7]
MQPSLEHVAYHYQLRWRQALDWSAAPATVASHDTGLRVLLQALPPGLLPVAPPWLSLVTAHHPTVLMQRLFPCSSSEQRYLLSLWQQVSGLSLDPVLAHCQREFSTQVTQQENISRLQADGYCAALAQRHQPIDPALLRCYSLCVAWLRTVLEQPALLTDDVLTQATRHHAADLPVMTLIRLCRSPEDWSLLSAATLTALLSSNELSLSALAGVMLRTRGIGSLPTLAALCNTRPLPHISPSHLALLTPLAPAAGVADVLALQKAETALAARDRLWLRHGMTLAEPAGIALLAEADGTALAALATTHEQALHGWLHDHHYSVTRTPYINGKALPAELDYTTLLQCWSQGYQGHRFVLEQLINQLHWQHPAVSACGWQGAIQ